VRHMPQNGPLARSVADVTLALRLIAGPDGRDWEIPPVALEPATERPLAQVRLAWTDDFGGIPVTADTSAALTKLAGALDGLGTPIERCLPAEFDVTAAWETWGELSQAEVGSTLSWEEEESGRRLDAALDSDVAISRGAARAVHATMRQYTAILMKRDGLITALEQFFAHWDALLCPVTVGPAFPHCPSGTQIAVDGRNVPYLLSGLAFTTPFNLTGHPVVVLPLGRSAEGLPIGLQVIGRRWGEMQLLTIAEQLAEVIGPFQRPSGY
jgi:amidase